MTIHVPSFGALRPSQIVAEYDKKAAALDDALAAFEGAATTLKTACTIGGEWGGVSIDTGRIHKNELRKALLTSAWRHVYKVAHIDKLATASEKRRFEQSMSDPAPFTMDNLRATFGKYIADPRGSILRGLAEVFCDLDPAYKSHDKMKIGVQGLPKRVILSNVGGYGSWGRDRLVNILNALAVYQGKPMPEYREIEALLSGQGLLDSWTAPGDHHRPEVTFPARGVWLKRFANGNGHLFFAPDTLRDINRALAEFYGDVLPDAHEERPDKPRAGTAVSKDLQYYPTPAEVVECVLDRIDLKGKLVLEPSCGCGRFMDEMRKRHARCRGIEVHPGRAAEARAKGHAVYTANFLDTAPEPIYDLVVMNPPFYGKHYIKHVEHALKWLKRGGQLVSILPITARHDHGIINGEWAEERGARMSAYDAWFDLPLGSFAESGTNINTTVLTLWRD